MIGQAIQSAWSRYQIRTLTRGLMKDIEALTQLMDRPQTVKSEVLEERLLVCLLTYQQILNLSTDPRIRALIHRVGHDVHRSYAIRFGTGAMSC